MTDDHPIPPLRAAILAQVFGALIALGLVALLYRELFALPLAVACVQGICAAFASYKLDAPPWWPPIHVVFMPFAVLASGLDIAPGWYLGAFALLLLVFWRTDRTRVPLFLTNEKTALAVAGLIPPERCRVIDLGCGNGALIRRLARLRPDCSFLGVEHAPLPWLWARLSTAGMANCHVCYGDFWQRPLTDFAVVYAFLSPAPMPRLWAKAAAEMRPGALLISNSFEIPGISPDHVTPVDDRRATRLLCYRPGG
jgi:SAM-dependent methyltransferase